MARLKGMKAKDKIYEKYNYCSRCCEWLEGKPLRCTTCNNLARARPKYNKGKYAYSAGAKRY